MPGVIRKRGRLNSQTSFNSLVYVCAMIFAQVARVAVLAAARAVRPAHARGLAALPSLDEAATGEARPLNLCNAINDALHCALDDDERCGMGMCAACVHCHCQLHNFTCARTCGMPLTPSECSYSARM